MPATLTYPGVYIEELPSSVRTITGVGTSITAPERASLTLNDLSSALWVSASLNASKCTAVGDQ